MQLKHRKVCSSAAEIESYLLFKNTFCRNQKNMAMNGKSLGKERLTLIHSRVKQIAERNNYNEKDGLKVEKLCEFCEYQLNERQGFKWECHPSSKEFLIKCSGVTWVCESRSMIINFKHVPWGRATLIPKKKTIKF